MTDSNDSPAARPDFAAPLVLAVFGATGGVGRLVVRQALDAGHTVRALCRSRARWAAARPVGAAAHEASGRVVVVEGDARDAAAVARTLAGASAVVCALGAPASSASRIRSEGTAAIVRGMREAGIDRVIALSTYGVGETARHLPPLLRWVVFPLILGRVVAEHTRQERILADSGTRYTVVRPPSLTDGPPEPALIHGFDEPRGLSMRVSRASVAAFVLDELRCERYVRATPAVAAPTATPSAFALAVRGALPGAAVSAALSGALNYAILPLPTSLAANAAGHAASGFVSALISTVVGVLLAVRALSSARPPPSSAVPAVRR